MSDSWILIGLTILIVFLLFYISKRLICSGPILTSSSEESPPEEAAWSSGNLCDSDNNGASEKQLMTICGSNNNTVDECGLLGRLSSQSLAESRLRSQIFHMILAEKQYQQLEVEAARLARLLTQNQGSSPEDYINNLRNEMFPLITVASFHPHQHRLLLSKYIHGSTNYFITPNSPSDPNDLSTTQIIHENENNSSFSQNIQTVSSSSTTLDILEAEGGPAPDEANVPNHLDSKIDKDISTENSNDT